MAGLQTTTDRSTIPALDSDWLVLAGQANLSKYIAPLVTAVVAVLAGVIPNTGLGDIPKFSALPDTQRGIALFGILLLIGLSVLGLSLVWSADLKGRAMTTSANLSLRALPNIITLTTPAGVPGDCAGLWVTTKTTGDDEFLVVGARKQDGHPTEYLLARGKGDPQWTPETSVKGFLVKNGALTRPA